MNHTETLNQAIEASGLSIGQFSEKLGLSRQSVYQWRYENHVPERWRGKVASMSRGLVRPEDFTPVWEA